LTTKKAKLKCPECGKLFANATGLGGHRSKVHGVEGNGKSTVALREKQGRDALTTLPPAVPVVRAHEFRCPECHSLFANAKDLGLHRRNKHKVRGITAGSVYAQKKRVEYLANYQRDNDGKLICPECGEGHSEAGITFHRKMVHKLNAEQQIKLFAKKPVIVAKIETIAEVEGPVKCPHCDFVANSKKGLLVHVGFKHEPSQTPNAIERRRQREKRNKTIEQPTQAIAIAETNGNLGHRTEEAHPVASGYTIPDATLAVALGRFQGLCASFSAEFNLPPRSFATRLAELIYHSQIR
jgi:uncharacterized C2H2 Zn-finger protein